jgi:Tfp pilus assembly protein PilP
MKTKPTVTILACVLAAGSAWAQSPSVVQNTRNTMNGVSDKATAASNQALGNQAPVSHPATPAVGAIHAVPKSGAVAMTPAARAEAKARRGMKTKGIMAVASRHTMQPKPEVIAKTGTVASNTPAGSGEVESETEQSVAPDSKYNANGRRDPFVSPVVSHAGGSGCSTGKKCLEIGTINLRGVVHGENGFIAVVSNSLNKAYFLRENDPVFNGYVMRITGDSIVFQETLQDRMGKTFTREVVKKITAPAV